MMTNDQWARAYHQTSDNLSARVIQACTKDCGRDDCCLSARIGGTTLLAVNNHYDKNGNHIISNQNDKNVKLTCRICWQSWDIHDCRDGSHIIKKYDLKEMK